MIASKLTFSSEALDALNSPILTPKKRAELRKFRVVDYIKKHEGEEIHIAILIREAGYNPKYVEGDDSYKHGWALINKLVANKTILKEKGHSRGFAKYYVNRPKIQHPAPVKLADTEIDLPHDKPINHERRYYSFIEAAKKFAWDNNSDSLRDFIKTL